MHPKLEELVLWTTAFLGLVPKTDAGNCLADHGGDHRPDMDSTKDIRAG